MLKRLLIDNLRELYFTAYLTVMWCLMLFQGIAILLLELVSDTIWGVHSLSRLTYKYTLLLSATLHVVIKRLRPWVHYFDNVIFWLVAPIAAYQVTAALCCLTYYSHIVINMAVGALVGAVALNFICVFSVEDPVAKFNHLVTHLVLMGVWLMVGKNEQYVPLLMLTECGTLFIIFNIIKHSQRARRSKAVVYGALIPFILLLLMLVTPNSIYWVNTTVGWLITPNATHDFSGLSTSLLQQSRGAVLTLFFFLLSLTLFLIMINVTPPHQKSLTQLTKAALHRQRSNVTNSTSEYLLKQHGSSVNRFNK